MSKQSRSVYIFSYTKSFQALKQKQSKHFIHSSSELENEEDTIKLAFILGGGLK